jgi:hypothetical protein
MAITLTQCTHASLFSLSFLEVDELDQLLIVDSKVTFTSSYIAHWFFIERNLVELAMLALQCRLVCNQLIIRSCNT